MRRLLALALAGLFGQGEDPRAGQQAADFLQRHEEQLLAGEADHLRLGQRRGVAAGRRRRQFDAAHPAERHVQAGGFQHHAGGADDPPAGAVARHGGQPAGEAAEGLLPVAEVRVAVHALRLPRRRARRRAGAGGPGR